MLPKSLNVPMAAPVAIKIANSTQPRTPRHLHFHPKSSRRPPATSAVTIPGEILATHLHIACAGSLAAVPASLRLIQIKKKLAAAPPPTAAVPVSLRLIQIKKKLAAAPAALGSAGSAVAALASAFEAVHCAAAAVGGDVGDAAARKAGDAVAWVFGNVHFASPELAVGLLGIMAACLGSAVETEMTRIKAEADTPANEAEEAVESDLWAKVGILHGEGDKVAGGDQENGGGYERRKKAYESIIESGAASSLILSNYAQLLYQYDKDLNRAEEYFKQAVAAEPVDGEAMRRYAMFLWQGRGDIVGAEDMFTEAIDSEPESSQHRSSYAWFLWMTGGVGTCIVGNDDDGNKNN